MRLLSRREDGEFSLDEFLGNIPAYAILSHTWGSKDDEVTYQDLQRKAGKEKAGYRKLSFCGEQAAKDGLRYFWIDTCCIDKSSSAELSEALTSMFRWYQNSVHCYAYLSDVSVNKRKVDHDDLDHSWMSSFQESKWFTRGWTLQELIAPRTVIFFSQEGVRLGDKLSLERTIHDITHIPVPALRTSLGEFAVEHRLRWMEGRHTTREEDRAYSMAGIVGVSMLPMYGEGKERAFARLRKEIREAAGEGGSVWNVKQKQTLLESLKFEQIDARHMSIKSAHAETCKWILKNRQYLEWLDTSRLCDHHGFLWIKGKAGAGKSTLMKYIFGCRKVMKDQATLSFFFNARGGELEKSTIGAYRSLLVQILENFPATQTFDALGLSTSDLGDTHIWNVDMLKLLLERALQTLGGSRLVCFVDALDECHEEKIRDMVQFFERLSGIATAINLCFQVCFSSRHYPHITLRTGLELVLEGQEGHTQDITDYIETELKIGQSKVAQQIRLELQEKASGIFMWVVLVVGILNKQWDRGQVHTLQRKLREIPADLHALFRDILTRDTDDKANLVLCIQWILFSREPLSPGQLYHAIISGVDPDGMSACDYEDITEDVFERFILDCSKGLAETTLSKKEKVHFIHESVRDFLLKENGLGEIWPELKSNFQGQSHERLKQCCAAYCNLVEATPSNTPGELAIASSQQLVIAQPLVVQKLPFLEYAIRNLPYHADAAQGSGVSQAAFIDNFPSPQWIRLSNLIEVHKVRRYSEHVSCTYLLAELNMANLLQVCVTADRCMEIIEERYGCALFAAFATGSDEALQVCMECLQPGEETVGSRTSRNEVELQQQTIKSVKRRGYHYTGKKGLLLSAAELGLNAVVAYLVNSGLFELDALDSQGRNVLWWASTIGCEKAVSLLLSIDSSMINQMDNDNQTPLFMAAKWGHAVVARILLNNGADPNVRCRRHGNPLQAAVNHGYKQIVYMLLKAGADANFQNDHGVTPLRSASCCGFKKIVKMLLDHGADVNLERGTNLPPLLGASLHGHVTVVNLLLNAGADVNIQNCIGMTALSCASLESPQFVIPDGTFYEDDQRVDQRVVDHGRRLLSINEHRGRRPVTDRQKALVKLLLDNGANPNAQVGRYGNELCLASSNGDDAIVRMLLDAGANVNAQCRDHGNALKAALCNNHQVVVDMLMASGAGFS